MADLAIDPTDIRTPSTPVEAARPLPGRKTLLIAGAATLGIAALGGAAAAIVSNITLPSNLSGLASLPKPDAPRRSEIRIGRLPDMPEIRDGVPAVVGTKPVRVVELDPAATPSNSGAKAVAATIVPAATLPGAPLPTTFTGPGAPQHLISAVSAPLGDSGRLQASSLAVSAPELRTAAAPSAPLAREAEKIPSAAAFRKPEPPTANPEPASTASVPTAVPLPPPAPVRSLARAPESKVEKPAPRPAQLASRQAVQPVAPPPAETVSQPAPPAPDDRVEILGVKLPNGSDLKNAVSSLGDALNLPKAF